MENKYSYDFFCGIHIFFCYVDIKMTTLGTNFQERLKKRWPIYFIAITAITGIVLAIVWSIKKNKEEEEEKKDSKRTANRSQITSVPIFKPKGSMPKLKPRSE